ncbi:MAG: TIGR04283 family arsenosugar biosynthesis glycosyltransferase [Rhodospirillales bacterium]
MLSVVIPTLNAAAQLKVLLDGIARVRSAMACEVIVADGGSSDATSLVASQGGAIFLEAVRGRGRQMASGAEAAAGDWLLFLHADTRLDPNWVGVIDGFVADPANAFHAGYFRFALDDDARGARLLERVVAWRSRFLGLPYGDQGLLISRQFYDVLGGYKRIPLMEDVDIVRRIGRRKLIPLDATALTSAEKYQRDGYVVRPLVNLLLLGLYRVGVPPRYIFSMYR